MIRSLDGDIRAFPHYDVCIVGSGPAGITVCAELVEFRAPHMRFGERNRNKHGIRRFPAQGRVSWHRVSPESRERILGGASHTWCGLSVPLDPVDFAARGWPHHSGWPITWEEFVPYLRSAERYGFPRLDAFACAGPFVDNAPAEPGWRNCEEKVFLTPCEHSALWTGIQAPVS